MDKRLQILRFWHLAIGGLVVAWLCPAVGICIFGAGAFVQFGLMMPVLAPPACDSCTVELEWSGVAAGTCSECTNLNSTTTTLTGGFSCDCVGSLNDCCYSGTFFPGGACAPFGELFRYTPQGQSTLGASFNRVRICTDCQFEGTAAYTSGCEGNDAFTRIDSCAVLCDHSASSATITAV